MRPYGAGYHQSSLRLGKGRCTLQGEARLTGDKFTGYFSDVLKLGQGACLCCLLILCQQNTLKGSHSLTVQTEAASASDLPFRLKHFSGVFLPRAAGRY